MEDLLFAVIALAATVAFILGILSGFWPIFLAVFALGIGLAILLRR